MARKAPNASKACDDARRENNNVVAEIDPKPSTNGNTSNDNNNNDDDSNEPAFSPAATESNPSSSTSVTPTPPSPQNENENGNERISDNELHGSDDKQGDEWLPTVKTEKEACESDAETDYSTDSTEDFNFESLKRVVGLKDGNDCGEQISNENVTDPSKFLNGNN